MSAPSGSGSSGMKKVPSVSFVEPPPSASRSSDEHQPARIRYSNILKSMYGGSFISGSAYETPDTAAADQASKRAFDSSAQPAKPAMKQPARRLVIPNQYPMISGSPSAGGSPAPSYTSQEVNPATGMAYQTRGGAALASALGVGAMPIPPACPPALPPTASNASSVAGSVSGAAAAGLSGSSNASHLGHNNHRAVPNPLAAPELPYMAPSGGSGSSAGGAAGANGSHSFVRSGSQPLLISGDVGSPLSPPGSYPGARVSDDSAALLEPGLNSHHYGPPEPALYKPVPVPQGTAHVTVQLAPINTGSQHAKPLVNAPGEADVMSSQQHQYRRDQGEEDHTGWQHLQGAAGAGGPGSFDGVVGPGSGSGDDDHDGASSCAIIPPGSQEPLPLFWSQLTFRAVLVGLVVGFGFVLLNMRLALVTGVTPNLQVVIAGGCWTVLRCYTSILGRDMACIPVLTAQEVTVAASTALAVASSAASGSFGTVLLALQDPIAQRVGSSIPGNLPSLVWSVGYWKLVVYMLVVGLSGALLMLPFRKLLFARPSMTFATGAAAGQLVNTLHTPAMSYHGHKQMHRFAQWSAISFVFSGYQWVFNNPACNGFRRFPTFGLEALRYTWNFDFQLPFVGLGILAPLSVTWSLLVGGVVTWGLLWPVLSSKEGTWYPAQLQPWDIRGAYGYHLVVALALLLADAAYHIGKGIMQHIIALRSCKGREVHDSAEPHESAAAGPQQQHGRGSRSVMDELEVAAAAAAADPGPGSGFTKRSLKKKRSGKNSWRLEALRIVETDTLSDASSLQFSMAAMERALRQHIFMADDARSWVGIVLFIVLSGAAVIALPSLFSFNSATAVGGASKTAAALASCLKYYHVLVAAALTVVAALANARGAGVTDINMADVYAKLGMVVFAAWAAPGVGSSGAGLLCGGLLAGASTSAVNALYAWRAGFMTMSSPTAVFIAHMIGLGVGCVAAPAAWLLFDVAARNGGLMGAGSSLVASDGFYASPVAAVFRSTAALASSGVSGLPLHALWVALSALVVGLVLNALRDTLPGQARGLVPIPAAVGVVCLSGASIAVDLAVGAAARIFWRLRYPRSADAYALVVGCALIAGEGIWGLGQGLLSAFGMMGPICMSFSLPPQA